MIYFVEETGDFRLCCGRFVTHGTISLFWEIWIGQPTKVVRPITIGKDVGGVSLKSEGRRAEWMIRKCVVLTDIEVGSG